MLLALVLLNVAHPGRIMSGKTSDMPTRKERKLGMTMKSTLSEYALPETLYDEGRV